MQALKRFVGLSSRASVLDADGGVNSTLGTVAPIDLARMVIPSPKRLHGDAETIFREI